MLRAWKREKRVSKLVLAEKPSDVILKQCLIKLFGEQSVADHWTDITAKAALDAYFAAELAASVLFPGVMEMLHTLHADGLKLALITNSTDTLKQLAVLDQLELTRWFDPIIVSSGVGYRKPDSRIFRMVFDHWELNGIHFARDEVVMVGDVLSRDVLGAQRIGMRSVLIEWPGEIDKSNLRFRDHVFADRVITAMTELPAAITSMNTQWRALHAQHGHPQIITDAKYNCDCAPLPTLREEVMSPSASASPPAASPSRDGPLPELVCTSPTPHQATDVTPSGQPCPPSCSSLKRVRSLGYRMASMSPSATAASPLAVLSSPVLTPTTPFFRPLRIGYAFNTKKANTCRAEHWFDTRYREDATYVEVDIKKPLEPQGPFDVLLMKLTDYMIRTDDESRSIIERFRKYLAANPHIVVVDPLDSVATCLDRAKMATALSLQELRTPDGIRAAAPAVVIVTLPLSRGDIDGGVMVNATGVTSREPSTSSSTPDQKMKTIEWPVICKRVEACGSTQSHHMVIVTNVEGMKQLDAGEWLVQQYVNHDRILHKVYVLGNDTTIVSKHGSLPNVDPRVDRDNIYVDSHNLSSYSVGKSLASSGDRELEKHVDAGLVHINTTSDASFNSAMNNIAGQLRDRLGISLFGFDVLQPSKPTTDIKSSTTSPPSSSSSSSLADYYIVDVNHFPSYDGVSEFPQKLLNFLCDHWRYSTTNARSFSNVPLTTMVTK